MNSARAKLTDILRASIQDMKNAGTFKVERIITSPQSNIIETTAEKRVLNFCANNYLGLSDHSAVVKAAELALVNRGSGLSSVRFICGTMDIHKELEDTITQFHGTEDTILYPSCFDANAGLFEALLNDQDAIISDSLNHASIIDGIRLCKAKRFRYKHLDMHNLEVQLIEATRLQSRIKLIATDGVFSMDGSLAPLNEICALADKYEALVFVDECHATGFFGPEGKGTPHHFGVADRVDIVNSTLGKCLGGASGGYTTASKEIITMLRQKSRPYLFSNSIPPPVVASAMKSFEIVMGREGDVLRRQLIENTQRFRSALKRMGFQMRGSDNHPIVPVMLGDARLASEMADELLKHGIYVIGFSYPVVPEGQARIRCQISAAHTAEDIEKAITAFGNVGKKFGVIKSHL